MVCVAMASAKLVLYQRGERMVICPERQSDGVIGVMCVVVVSVGIGRGEISVSGSGCIVGVLVRVVLCKWRLCVK